MNEDLSAQIRLSVSYVILGVLIVFTVASVIVASQVLNNLTKEISTSVSYIQQGSMEGAVGRTMSGAACYRICKSANDAISDFQIKVKTGGEHTYYDVEDLMKNKLMGLNFNFNSYSNDGTMWIVSLEEVLD